MDTRVMMWLGIFAGVLAGVVRLNVWHSAFQKKEKIRRAALTPDELDEDEAKAWLDETQF
jgi:hypothetical protein